MEDALDLESTIELEPGALVPLSEELWAIAAADLDGDGDTDFVAGTVTKDAAVPYGLQILLNNGDGSFTASRMDLEQAPYAIVTADFDRDVDVDLAVSIGRKGLFLVLLNRGKGQFESPRTYGEGLSSVGSSGASSFLAADLNNDGYADLAFANRSPVKVFLNDGEGGFEYGSVVGPAEPASTVTFISAADMDADGDIDFVANGDSARFFLNEGDATFQIREFALPGGVSGAFIPADLDGDRDLDLVVGGKYIRILLNRGDLTFPFSASFEPVGEAALSVLDVDSDGDSDIAAIVTEGACSDCKNQITLLTNVGHGMLREGPSLSVGAGAGTILQGDFDDDGKLDLAVTDSLSKTIALLLNRSQKAVSLDENRNGIPDDCERPQFHRGDPNEDGRLNISDAVLILKHLFGPDANPLRCPPAGDANDDNTLNLTDAVYLLNFLFRGGLAPPPPGPPSQPCGEDATPPPTGQSPCIYTSC